MANHKRKKPRTQVRCCMCTPHRLGNNNAESRYGDSTKAKVERQAHQRVGRNAIEAALEERFGDDVPSHIRVMADAMIAQGEGKRFIVSMPRNYGKSVMRQALRDAGLIA